MRRLKFILAGLVLMLSGCCSAPPKADVQFERNWYKAEMPLLTHWTSDPAVSQLDKDSATNAFQVIDGWIHEREIESGLIPKPVK